MSNPRAVMTARTNRLRAEAEANTPEPVVTLAYSTATGGKRFDRYAPSRAKAVRSLETVRADTLRLLSDEDYNALWEVIEHYEHVSGEKLP